MREIRCLVCGKTIYCTRSEQRYMDRIHTACKPLAGATAYGALRGFMRGGDK